ncbi:MAG: hypothetical protein LBJ41_03285 [Treponema sp.]|jgi:hypothetical protein|nr:hypothetical protein [Treponema sp.]
MKKTLYKPEADDTNVNLYANEACLNWLVCTKPGAGKKDNVKCGKRPRSHDLFLCFGSDRQCPNNGYCPR